MAHDVYICYDERDLETAKKVCDTLEDNGLDCWLKNRDTGAKRMVDEIMDAIKKSKVMVLLFSKNSKDSNFVNNEVDIAFAQKRSILVFQIDDSKLDGGLEFFLRNKPRIEAFPNPEDEFDRLIENTSKMVKEQGAIDRNIFKIIKDHKVPVIIGIVVILLVVGVLGYMAYNGGGSQTNATKIKAGDIKINITDFHVDDVRKEKTNWNYSYYVGGKITPAPGENDGFVILVDFYDESGNLVDTVDTPFKEAEKVKSGFLLGSTVSDKNNIKIADVQLVNKNNMVIAQDEAQL
ncbi:toll/interleukin-1 receptor domain-containing protein [uncultured Methanobrevibacter sp.]|uniref:toll/interleukin-1 receptor domain-containing protein n=1 Tax=uncultured Methanobrevibacter sp. TaxID=253161 RepID=UPI0025ECF66C|nr:toll/interleukin-1 receptor domain-containing protein [uncultured Methanobrevibacter sp.]